MLDKLKKYAAERSVGYWFTLAVAVAMLVLIIVYPVNFYWSQYYEPKTLVFLIVGLVLGVALLVGGVFWKPLEAWAPAALGAGVFVSTLFFFVGSWLMIQDAVGGYEDRGFIDGFWPFVVLAILAIVASIVNIVFLKQRKSDA